jgi:hypothetical protein
MRTITHYCKGFVPIYTLKVKVKETILQVLANHKLLIYNEFFLAIFQAWWIELGVNLFFLMLLD